MKKRKKKYPMLVQFTDDTYGVLISYGMFLQTDGKDAWSVACFVAQKCKFTQLDKAKQAILNVDLTYTPVDITHKEIKS